VELKINDNIIKDTSFIELNGIINKLKKLKVIDLSDSGLGGENSLEIFNSLIKIDSLEEIYLNYNEIEEKEIQFSSRFLVELLLFKRWMSLTVFLKVRQMRRRFRR
jgi:hypothetical protein